MEGASRPSLLGDRSEERPAMDWLTICAADQDDACIQPIQVAYLVALIVGAVLLSHRRPASARLHDGHPHADGRGHRDQRRGGVDHLRAASADLPRFDRDGPRRRPGRAVGRRPDRAPVEPHLVDPADPRRGRTERRVLRPGRRGHRPDGRASGAVVACSGCARRTLASAGSWPSRPASPRTLIAMVVVQSTIGLSFGFEDDPTRRCASSSSSLALVAVGVAVAWISGRTIFRLEGRPDAARQYLTVAAAVAAGAFVVRDLPAAVRADRLLLGDGRPR